MFYQVMILLVHCNKKCLGKDILLEALSLEMPIITPCGSQLDWHSKGRENLIKGTDKGTR